MELDEKLYSLSERIKQLKENIKIGQKNFS